MTRFVAHRAPRQRCRASEGCCRKASGICPIATFKVPSIFWHLHLAATTLAIAGCDSQTIGDLTGAAFHWKPERLVEVPLGDAYFAHVVGMARHEEGTEEMPDRNRLLIRFRLIALVRPHQEALVLQRAEAYDARLRDEVIRACRRASLDDLSEPTLGTLSAQLTKIARKYLGPNYIRRVIMTNVLVEPT